MCEQCQKQAERDARFWRAMRRALMAAAKAIAERYPENNQSDRRAA